MSDWLLRGISRPSGPLSLLAGYFLLQWLIRIIGGSGFELDESELLLFGQRLQAGYSSSPPLYTWLQIPLLRLFGDGPVALALLKNLLLFLSYSFCYFAGRSAGLGVERAGVAALSLLLLPQIGWESQRDLTNSVLVTTLSAATLWALIALLNGRRDATQYALIGLLFGLGMLAKYNFALLMLVAVISLATLQPRLVWRPAVMLTVLLSALTVTPFLLWFLDNAALAASDAQRLETADAGYWSGVGEGLFSLLVSYAAFCALFLLALLLSFKPWQVKLFATAEQGKPLALRFLQRMFWITPLILLLILLLAGGVLYRDRYLLPVLFYLPLLAFLTLPERLFELGMRAYRRWLLAALLLIPLGMLLRAQLLPMIGKPMKLSYPGQELAQILIQDGGAPGFVVTNRSFIGGNLKPYLGDAFVASAQVQFPLRELMGERSQPVLLVWEPHRTGREYDKVKAYLKQQLGEQVGPLSEVYRAVAQYGRGAGPQEVLEWQLWGEASPLTRGDRGGFYFLFQRI